jgi:hypothetical protein
MGTRKTSDVPLKYYHLECTHIRKVCLSNLNAFAKRVSATSDKLLPVQDQFGMTRARHVDPSNVRFFISWILYSILKVFARDSWDNPTMYYVLVVLSVLGMMQVHTLASRDLQSHTLRMIYMILFKEQVVNL